MRRPVRTLSTLTAALTAAATAAALLGPVPGAAAAKQPDVVKQSQALRKAVKVKGIQQHLAAFQSIANANGGTRASGTPGYTASRDYVVQRLRAAGYRPQVQQFDFPFFDEKTPTLLQRTTPTPKDYGATDFAIMTYSGSGDVTAAVQTVDTDLSANAASTSGCEAADFTGFTAGSVALLQRGTCDFSTKVSNAAAAGAVAALVANRGTGGAENDDVFFGTLGTPSTIPALGLSFAAGQELAAGGTAVRVRTDAEGGTRTTWNVVAETPRGNAGRVIMAGAHLDSVPEGPGINDNGSGSATILEVAEELAKKPKKRIKNKVRFAWWGAEESGLLGSYHYVDDLVANNPGALGDIAAYLNFDMVGSPNFVRFVYDGDNSTGEGVVGPQGSAQIEGLFNRYFKARKLQTDPTAFDGRSDYGPFIENGVPAGGLFTGAEDVKTDRQARVYGGQAGAAYDACYHQACDTSANISTQALDQMSDAVAHAVWTLARSTKALKAPKVKKQGRSTVGASQRVTADRVGHSWTR